ncbi:MAG TPA: DNA polymerase/3'-5' exonuclease PolX [Chthoniobacterales bacterium]|nr:DNA polymerase/3'-5' exonuclease PolX [Chthoniobacterales bacterium]
MVTKEQTIDLLETIAQLLELKGENPFKIRAYTNAARALETYSGNFPKLVEENGLRELTGIGDAIAKKIAEYAVTGKLEYFEKLRSDFPESLFELFEVQGLAGKKIKVLWEKLQVKSIAELEVACRDGRVAELPGFGAKTAENLLRSIERRTKRAGRHLLSEASLMVNQLIAHFKDHPDVSQISAAGSLRRAKETIGDIDLLIATKEPARITEHFITSHLIERILAKGETKTSVILKDGMQADLRVVANHEFPFALAYFTGSKEHNVALRGRALQRGWTLNEYRLGPDPGAKEVPEAIPPIRTEEQLYQALGLAFVPAELREANGEIEAAERNELPHLIEWSNLRGTFHSHTYASDGRNSLEEMADAARELGLQYLGIADHSKSSFQAHGLEEKQLMEQVSRIRELNKSFDDDFKVFAGVECDILRDGTLDFADEVLSQLDFVVASVHSVMSLSEREMTDRMIRAMENRFVTMLGHPTGRLLLSRDASEVDLPAIIEAAARTKTIIELNANPRRLDMDWRFWRLAKSKGVLCSINPDAHSIAGLEDLWFGVQIARKGWLQREDVINCLPLNRIEKAIYAKRNTTPRVSAP